MINAVFFSTSTCKHCGPFKKTFASVAEMYDEDEMSVTYRVVDTDPESYQIFKEYGLGGVPAVIFVNDNPTETDPQNKDISILNGTVTQTELVNLVQGLIQRNVLPKPS